MTKFPHKSPISGFTLLEVLLVVAAIAILAGIAIFAINPGKQLGEMRNGQRRADVSLIVNALYQYFIDNPTVTVASVLPVRDVADCTLQTDTEIALCTPSGCGMNLSFLTDNQKYLVSVPADPAGGLQANHAGYFVYANTNNRIIACAPRAELGATIEVTK